jgi:hypothetical protein
MCIFFIITIIIITIITIIIIIIIIIIIPALDGLDLVWVIDDMDKDEALCLFVASGVQYDLYGD